MATGFKPPTEFSSMFEGYIPVVPEDTVLLKPFGTRACGVANPRDTNGYRCGSRLAIPFSKRLINSASSSTTGIKV
jgi:hypothetical protein